MNIKYGMILAAGLGKRMQPLTLKTPKPLLEINNYTLLERAINLLISHGVQEISINVHYLPDQIKSFINRKKFKVKITISNEENLLLDTGGGVLKGTQNFGDNPFFVINPDTVWSKHYLTELKSLEVIYLKNNKPTLLLVNKKLSIDPSFKGDFNLNNEKISKDSENQFIFTGLQIINRSVFANEKSEVFSLNKVWNKLIKDKNLLGLESNQKFYHLNTSDMYRKIQSLNIID
jgi:MurNAc alpha-1-phosphate uridylyltransferase